MTQQTAFTTCKDSWNAHAWTEDETSEWQMFASMNPIKNRLGETCYLFPYIAFLKVNIPRVMNSDPIVYVPVW